MQLRTVTLIDGRTVPSDSRDWLMECLARHILARPLDVRRQWLADMERKGDNAGADELRDAMRAVHACGRRHRGQRHQLGRHDRHFRPSHPELERLDGRLVVHRRAGEVHAVVLPLMLPGPAAMQRLASPMRGA